MSHHQGWTKFWIRSKNSFKAFIALKLLTCLLSVGFFCFRNRLSIFSAFNIYSRADRLFTKKKCVKGTASSCVPPPNCGCLILKLFHLSCLLLTNFLVTPSLKNLFVTFIKLICFLPGWKKLPRVLLPVVRSRGWPALWTVFEPVSWIPVRVETL